MKKSILSAITLLLVSVNGYAATTCPEAKIQSLYPTDDKLFIQLEGYPWHVLAVAGEDDYDKKLNRAMKAQKKDLNVELSFPNGYDESCMASNTDVVAKKIKLIKKKKNKD